jgi:hypothetical protein
MEGFGGVTAIETSAAELTVMVAEALIVPRLALIKVEPPLKPLANPVLLIPATAGVEELQLTNVVKFCVLPSLYCPVAANCWFCPIAIVGFVGLIVMRERVAGITVRTVKLLTAPAVAVIVTWPVTMQLATPPDVMEATDGAEEVQFTEAVRSCVLPSVKVPVAVNGCAVPAALDGF